VRFSPRVRGRSSDIVTARDQVAAVRATLEHLTAVVGDLTGRTSGPVRPAALNAWRAPDWHAVLLDIPLDERAYADRFQVARRTEIEGLWRWWAQRRDTPRLEPRAAGFLGFYLLTLVGMHCSDRMRFHGDAPREVALAGTTAEGPERHRVPGDEGGMGGHRRLEPPVLPARHDVNDPHRSGRRAVPGPDRHVRARTPRTSAPG
jgi:hypothetical protein